MNCPRAEELLSDYQEGALHEVLRLELQSHLQECEACAELAQALDEVLGALRAGRPADLAELEPASDLAARAARASIEAGRRAPAARAWRLPSRVQALAAGLALLATGAIFGARAAFVQGWPQRVVDRAAGAGVLLIERKDRLVEDLRMVRVMVGATFAGRVDGVTARVDDYRRLLERRRAATPAAAEPGAPPSGRSAPGSGISRARSPKQFANRAGHCDVRTG